MTDAEKIKEISSIIVNNISIDNSKASINEKDAKDICSIIRDHENNEADFIVKEFVSNHRHVFSLFGITCEWGAIKYSGYTVEYYNTKHKVWMML